MKEKILIAIDSSDSSSKVLAYGINLAGKLDAEVKVVHVIEPYSKRSTILNQLNPAMVKQTNELYELAGQELMEADKKTDSLPPKFPFIMKLCWQRRAANPDRRQKIRS